MKTPRVFTSGQRESVYALAVTLTTQQLPSEQRVLSRPKVVVKVIRFWEDRRAGAFLFPFKQFLE